MFFQRPVDAGYDQDQFLRHVLLPEVEAVLKDDQIVKVGWGLENDMKALLASNGVLLMNVIDVQLAFREQYVDSGLRRLYIAYCQLRACMP